MTDGFVASLPSSRSGGTLRGVWGRDLGHGGRNPRPDRPNRARYSEGPSRLRRTYLRRRPASLSNHGARGAIDAIRAPRRCPGTRYPPGDDRPHAIRRIPSSCRRLRLAVPEVGKYRRRPLHPCNRARARGGVLIARRPRKHSANHRRYRLIYRTRPPFFCTLQSR